MFDYNAARPGCLLGVDIGGTKCAVILGREEGGGMTVIEKRSFPTRVQEGPRQAVDRILSTADEMLAARDTRPTAVGVSCGGPLDSKRGLILSPPNLTGWDNIPITDILSAHFKVPARLQNDANACALAEWKFGAGRGTQSMIFLTFGTGLGAGLILDGRLYCGACDMAGEAGHIRLAAFGPAGYGKAGSFEGFCSGGGIAQLARTMVLERLQRGEKVAFCPDVSGFEALSAKAVGDAAEAGDKLTAEIYATSGRYLGYGLAILIDLLNPERIVIGSIFARSRALLWPYAREVIAQECLTLSAKACSVVPAALGERLGDMAALGVALEG